MSPDPIDATTAPLASVSPNTRNTSPEVELEEVAASLRHQRPKRWWVGLLTIAVLGGFGWLVYTRIILPMLLGMPPQFGPMKVAIADPIASTVRDSSEYVATLQSRQSVAVQPQVSGRITQIYVKSGDRVAAGAPLLQMDASEQQAQVAGNAAGIQAASAELEASRADADSARQSLEALSAERTSRKADLVFNEQEYRRFQNLYRQGATSKQQLDEKLNTLRQSKASIAQIDSQMKAQEAAIKRSQANILRSQQQRGQAIATANQGQVQLRYYTVKAPIDGTIGDIPAKVGDLVASTSQMLTVTQNRQLEIQIALPLEKEEKLRIGLPVQLLGQKGQVLQGGSVSYISPNVDPQNQSIQVKAIFDNSSGQLRTNQMVRARVIWNTRPGVLVPTTAISRLAGKNFVFVAEPYGRSDCAAQTKAQKVADPEMTAPQASAPEANQLVATQKPVTLGQIIGNNQEVIEGLSARDRIVVSGLLQLQSCAPIQASPAAPSNAVS
jgi:multidrug efflux pump subunit AcrA (membrane-fusion protein)